MTKLYDIKFLFAVASVALLIASLFGTNAMAGAGATTAQSASADDIVFGGSSTHLIEVVWDNNQTPIENLDFSTIDLSDITVTGPAGMLTVFSVVTTPLMDAPILTATYTIGAPGGSWDASDNGTYVVDINPNVVFLGAPFSPFEVGNLISQPAITSFNVSISAVPEPSAFLFGIVVAASGLCRLRTRPKQHAIA